MDFFIYIYVIIIENRVKMNKKQKLPIDKAQFALQSVSGSTCKYFGNEEGRLHACSNIGGKCERCSYYR